jgi:hypothetical protein
MTYVTGTRRFCESRLPDWLKTKNPAAPAVKREAEEDWAR